MNLKKERNEELYISFSMRVGMLSGVGLMMALILDLLSLFINTTIISLVAGLLELALFFWVFKSKSFYNMFDKIKNKAMLRQIIDSCTLSSVFAFIIEKALLPFSPNETGDKLVAAFVICSILVMPVGVFHILKRKKEWGYFVK